MPQWDAEQYLKFEAQRTRPSRELTAAIPLRTARRVLDVGCGPGNSTAVLQTRFPGADILGIDSSPEMIAAAQKAHPGIRFCKLNATAELGKLEPGFDVVFANASLQWMPAPERLLPALFALLAPGGVLAVQVPKQQDQPVHRVIREVAAREPWRLKTDGRRLFYTLEPEEYYDLLAPRAKSVDVWQTTYYHVLAGSEDIVEWYRGTGLRPYLEVLDAEQGAAFEAAVLHELTQQYPRRADGNILFRFPRLFFVAQK